MRIVKENQTNKCKILLTYNKLFFINNIKNNCKYYKK